MTSLYKSLLSRVVCVSILILASKIVSADISELDDAQKCESPSKGKLACETYSIEAPQLPNDKKNFILLMEQVNSLKIKGNVNAWSKAIRKYLADSSLDFNRLTLNALKDRILKEKIISGRQEKVKAIFKHLLGSKELIQISSPAQELVLLVFGPEDLEESGTIKFLDEDEKLDTAKKRKSEKVVSFSKDTSTSPADVPIAKLVPTTVAIEEGMKKFIAGQDRALKFLSSLAHRYMCNKLLVERKKKPASKPSHCILTGPTGCGKSETLRQLGKFLDVPILHINARGLTDEGYKGFNFSEAVSNFCKETKSPKSALVAIDEIDKLALSGGAEEKGFGQAIQRILLSCLDGDPISTSDGTYDISNWWFVCTGAFSALKGAHDDDLERTTTARTHQDIIDFGFEPEFVGRFSTVISFEGHTFETMLGVINKEGSPLNQAKAEFKTFYNIELSFEEKALRLLAESSIKIGLGVRSLHTVLNEILQPFYETASVGGIDSCLTIKESEVLPVIEKMKRDRKKSAKDQPPFGMYM